MSEPERNGSASRRGRGCVVAVALAILLVAWLGGRALVERVTPPGTEGRDTDTVVLVVFDRARADRFGPYRAGGGPAPTPALDALAAHAITFDDALTGSLATNAALASILTGQAVAEHGVFSVRDPGRHALPEGALTLAEALAAGGYRTFASVSLRQLGGALSGFGQGFEVYADEHAPADGAPATARATLDAIRAPLDAALASGDAVFVLVHLGDLRAATERVAAGAGPFLDAELEPLRASVPALDAALAQPELDVAGRVAALRRAVGRRRGSAELLALERALYDAALHEADVALGELFDLLRAHERYDDALVAVAGLQGSGAGHPDPDPQLAGFERDAVRVPLVVKLPRQESALRYAYPVATRRVFDTFARRIGPESRSGFVDHDLAIVAELEGIDAHLHQFYGGPIEAADGRRRAWVPVPLADAKVVVAGGANEAPRVFRRPTDEPLDEAAAAAAIARVQLYDAPRAELVVQMLGPTQRPLEVRVRSLAGRLRGARFEGTVSDASALSVTSAGDEARATLLFTPAPDGDDPLRLVVEPQDARAPLVVELGDDELSTEGLRAGRLPLAQAELLWLPDPVGAEWQAEPGAAVPWRAEFARRERGWIELAVAEPAGAAVEALLVRYPPGDPAAALEVEAGTEGDATVERVPGRLDAVRVRGTAPLTARVALSASDRVAYSIAVGAERLSPRDVRWLGRRSTRGGLVVYAAGWSDALAISAADALAGVEGTLALGRVRAGGGPAGPVELSADQLRFLAGLGAEE